MSEAPTYYQCSGCGTLHRASFRCFTHTPRWKRDELDHQFGTGGWREIQESELTEWRRTAYAKQAALSVIAEPKPIVAGTTTGGEVMEIIINGKLDPDPRSRILALEAVTQSICERFGMDPAEGTMLLLTAAVHIARKHSDKPARDISLTLANALGGAIVAADGFFTLREAGPADRNPPSTDADMRAFSASDAACYKWPDDTAEHRAARSAYIAGAADYGTLTSEEQTK